MSELGPPGSRTLLGAAVLGTGGTLFVAALGVARTKVLALGLDPDGLGLYGQMLTLLTALSAGAGLGLGLGTTRTVAECRARNDREGLEEALEVSVSLPLAIGAFLGVLIAGTSGLLAPLLLDDDRALLIVFAALAVPVVAIQGPLVHALQGFRDVRGAQGANVIYGISLTVASIAGVLIADLDGAVFALAVGNLAYAAALGWRLRHLADSAGVALVLRRGLRLDRLRQPLIQRMLGIGFASLFVGVISTAGELVVRTLVLNDGGATAAGIFSALQMISVQFIGVVVASVVFLSFTALSEAHAADDRVQLRRTLDDTLRLVLLLVLPLLLVIGLFRDDMVRLFLSREFDPAADLLPRELSGDALRTVAWALGAALVPVGLVRVWIGITVLTAAMFVGLGAILVPSHGVDGAVAAYVIEWGVAAILTSAVLLRRGLFTPSALTLRTLLAGGVAAALMLTLEPSWPVATVLVGAYCLALLFLCTGNEERLALRERIAGYLR